MPVLRLKTIKGKIVDKSEFGYIFRSFIDRPLVGDTIVNNKNEKYDIISIEVTEDLEKMCPVYTYNIKKKRKTKEA